MRARAVRAVARVAWMDLVALVGASGAMLPLVARRRPLGRELPDAGATSTPPPDRRASQA